MSDIYQTGNRDLQDHFNSRKLADRLEDMIVHENITGQGRGFMESRDMMFMSAADESGCPTPVPEWKTIEQLQKVLPENL